MDGLFCALQKTHIPYDLVNLREDVTPEDLARYQVAFYPHSTIFTKRQKEVLEKAVEMGLTLLFGCRSGYKDETGRCYTMPMPGYVGELTGCQVEEYTYVSHFDTEVCIAWHDKQAGAREFHDVLEVTEDGYVTILGTGTTQIYAVAKASDNFVRQVSDAITVTVEADPKPEPKPDNNQNQNGSANHNQTNQGNTASVKKAVIRKVQPKKAQVRVTWKKQAAAGSYEIRYALKKNMKNVKTVKANGKKSSITIKKLKSGKKYYIQVRAVKKNGVAVTKGAWSAKKSVRVK